MQIFTYPTLLSATLPLLFKLLCRRAARPLQRSHHRAKHLPHQQSHFWSHSVSVTFRSRSPHQLTPPVPGLLIFLLQNRKKNLSKGKRHISDLKTQAEISVINWLFSVLSNTGAEDNVLIAKILSAPICPVPAVQKDP